MAPFAATSGEIGQKFPRPIFVWACSWKPSYPFARWLAELGRELLSPLNELSSQLVQPQMLFLLPMPQVLLIQPIGSEPLP